MADCTPEQKKLVEEILSIKHTDYYRVLKVEKSSNDVEIKKAYRKLAIKLHPDKNKHPKASEAFKVIAKAFEILGDESKRKIYDMTGSDPDSRSSMGGSGGPNGGMGGFPGFQGFQGFPQGARGGGFGGGGLNEEILNMLFGMGGMGGMGNNGFSFQFGGNGFPNNGYYYSNPGMNSRRRAAQQQQQQQRRRNGNNGNNNNNGSNQPWSQYLIQFLPLIIILISVIINSLSDSSNSNTDGYKNVRQFSGRIPKFSFEPTDTINVERSTPLYNINYYIEQKTFDNFNGRKNPEKELKGLDKFVETQYIDRLSLSCLREKRYRDGLIQQAQGIFFNDWDKIKEANEMPMPNCERLEILQQSLL